MNNKQKQLDTEEQINLRLSLLKSWLASGVPSQVIPPKSLRQVRLWRADLEGIRPIGSDDTFKSTHVKYGQTIREIATILTKLHRPTQKKTRNVEPTQFQMAKRRVKELETAIGGYNNQIHEMINDLDKTKQDLRLTLSKLSFLEGENEELRARLARQNTPSKVVRGNFSKERHNEPKSR